MYTRKVRDNEENAILAGVQVQVLRKKRTIY